jgi:glucose-6-phosphate isomerase
MEHRNFKNPTDTESWKALQAHFQTQKSIAMKAMFSQEDNRANAFSILWDDVLFDYSKNRISKTTMKLLVDFAKEMDLATQIKQYFSGEKINLTENRAVLHTALRTKKDRILVDHHNIIPSIREEQARIATFCEAILNGTQRSSTGQQFTDVIHIGIGGSCLGPQMALNALSDYKKGLAVHYISNLDSDYNTNILKQLNPETTLIVVVSKSFKTRETKLNAKKVKHWLVAALGAASVPQHMVGVSGNTQETVAFGIAPNMTFKIQEWVGGRFSMWGSVGITIALSLGYANFAALRDGAAAMDEHFENRPFEENIPVVMALLNIWYTNFFGFKAKAVVPYKESLKELVAHLQQAYMESNGKSVDRNGATIHYKTGNILFGNTGVNSQHAFFQLLHQGTDVFPVDFIGFCKSGVNDKALDNELIANFLSQSKALMLGDEHPDLFKNFTGNRPSNTLLIDQLTPAALGKLIALYEHMIFVEGALLNINSYDQFGVALGKEICSRISEQLEQQTIANQDDSTRSLMQHYIKRNNQ